MTNYFVFAKIFAWQASSCDLDLYHFPLTEGCDINIIATYSNLTCQSACNHYIRFFMTTNVKDPFHANMIC